MEKVFILDRIYPSTLESILQKVETIYLSPDSYSSFLDKVRIANFIQKQSLPKIILNSELAHNMLKIIYK